MINEITNKKEKKNMNQLRKKINMLIEQKVHLDFEINMSVEDNSIFQIGVLQGWRYICDLIESISEEANADVFKEAEILIAPPEEALIAPPEEASLIDNSLILHKLDDLWHISTEILSMLTFVNQLENLIKHKTKAKQEDAIEAAIEVEEINNNFTLEDSTLEFLKGIASGFKKEANEDETAEDDR